MAALKWAVRASVRRAFKTRELASGQRSSVSGSALVSSRRVAKTSVTAVASGRGGASTLLRRLRHALARASPRASPTHPPPLPPEAPLPCRTSTRTHARILAFGGKPAPPKDLTRTRILSPRRSHTRRLERFLQCEPMSGHCGRRLQCTRCTLNVLLRVFFPFSIAFQQHDLPQAEIRCSTINLPPHVKTSL